MEREKAVEILYLNKNISHLNQGGEPTINLSALLEDNRLPSHMIASLLQEFYKSYMKE